MPVIEYGDEARTPLSQTNVDELPAGLSRKLTALDAALDRSTARVNANFEYEQGQRDRKRHADVSWAATERSYQAVGMRPDDNYHRQEKEQGAIIESAKANIAESQADSKKQTAIGHNCRTVLRAAEGLIRQRGPSLREKNITYKGGDPAGDNAKCVASRRALLDKQAALGKRPIPLVDFIADATAKLKARTGSLPALNKKGDLVFPVKALSLTPDLPDDVIPAVADLEGFVLSLGFDKLVEHIKVEAKRLYATLPEPLTDRDRAVELERIAKELKALEYEESAAFWAAWDRGIIIAPRPDISPSALLLVE